MNVGDGPPVSLPLPDPSDLRLVSYMFVVLGGHTLPDQVVQGPPVLP